MNSYIAQIQVGSIADCVYAVSTLGLMVAAFLGLHSWKTRTRLQSDHRLARRILINVFRIRDRVENLRSPFMSSAEYPPTNTNDLGKQQSSNRRYAYERRWKTVQEVHRKLEADLLVAEALWGDHLHIARNLVRGVLGDVYAAVIQYLDLADGNLQLEEPDMRILKGKVFRGYNLGGADEISTQLTEMVARFADELRPRII